MITWPQKLANNRLLIVDDEDGPRESLNLIFKDDYEVRTACNGAEAIELSRREPFSTAIVDIRMEDRTGIEVLQELKRIFPYTEVIMLTAYETLETARQAISLGASDYLSKPFDVENIQKVVKRCRDRFTFMTRQDLALRENMDRTKNEFLGVLSHELNTPMNGIMGFLELLTDTDLTEEQKSLMNDVKTCSLGLFETINDIVGYAQLVSRSQELFLSRFNPASMVLNLLVRHEGQNQDLRIVLNASPRLPATVYGPEIEIETILLKLMDNAIKFTPKGEVEVSVRAEALYSKRIELIHTIKDTGIGIPQRLLDSGEIFEPFNQGDNSLTRPFGGVGIGLSLCRKLCEKIDGKMEFESAPDEGTTVVFTVPVDA